jgi:hypothetical protein
MNVAKTLPIESGLQLIKKAAAQEYARACYKLTVQTAIDNLDIKELSNEEQLQFSSGIRLPELYLPLIETLSDADSVNNIRIAAEAGLKKAIVFAKEIAKFNNNVWEYCYWTAICGDCREMYHAMSNMTGLTEHSNGCSQKYILSDFTALMIRKAKDYISNSPADAHFACFAAYFCSRNGLDDAALDLCYLAKEHGMPMDTLIHSIFNSRDDWYNDNSDKNDYRQDSWDAMTDGMYGDYPGSGTDYDGIGF